jgi:hypothetical protein
MKLPLLHTLELELTHWNPPQTTYQQLKALSAELRLYCPNIERIIFVNDFERTVMGYKEGICRILGESEVSAELLWRETV